MQCGLAGLPCPGLNRLPETKSFAIAGLESDFRLYLQCLPPFINGAGRAVAEFRAACGTDAAVRQRRQRSNGPDYFTDRLVDRGSCDSRAVRDAAPKTEIGSIVGLRRRVAGMAPQI